MCNKPGVTNIGLTKLWKLIHFVDSQALREPGESVTGPEFIIYEHGPVRGRGDKHMGQMTRRGVLTTSPRSIGRTTLNEVKTTRKPGAFSNAELDIIDGVCARYGRKSAKELSPELMLYGSGEDAEGL